MNIAHMVHKGLKFKKTNAFVRLNKLQLLLMIMMVLELSQLRITKKLLAIGRWLQSQCLYRQQNNQN